MEFRLKSLLDDSEYIGIYCEKNFLKYSKVVYNHDFWHNALSCEYKL